MTPAAVAGLISGLLKLAGALAEYAERRQLLDAGRKEAIADGAAAVLEAVRRADRARSRSLDADSRVPVDGDLPDDGFRRD